jgi:hypothetical protein
LREKHPAKTPEPLFSITTCGTYVTERKKVMIQYERHKMLARAECVEAIDNRPERAHATLTDCGDVDDTMAGWQEEFEREIPIDKPGKERADGAQPSALPQVM